jgi:hypothetical protein
MRHRRRWCWQRLGPQALLWLFRHTRPLLIWFELDAIERVDVVLQLPSALLGLPRLAITLRLSKADPDPVDLLNIQGADLQLTVPQQPCSTLDLDMDLLLLPPATASYSTLGRLLHASSTLSNHQQLILCSVFCLALCAMGTPTAFPRRARRRLLSHPDLRANPNA